MKSPLCKFGCGCIGISLERPGRLADTTDVWLFSPCDGDSDYISGGVRPLGNEKVAAAEPLSEVEFEQVRMKTQQQLQAGEAMFDMQSAIERGAGCRERFHQRVILFPPSDVPPHGS